MASSARDYQASMNYRGAEGDYVAGAGWVGFAAIMLGFAGIWWMVSAVQRLSDVVLPFQQAAGGTQRIQDLLAEIPEVVDAPGALTLALGKVIAG